MFNRTLLASALLALFSQSALAADKSAGSTTGCRPATRRRSTSVSNRACSPPKASKWRSPVPAVAATW